MAYQIEDAHRLFNLWIDKTSSPYFSSNDIDSFLNQAIKEFVNDNFDTKPIHRAEATIRDVEELRELIVHVDRLRTNTSGVITDAQINSAIDVAVNQTGREFDYILNASKASSKECGGQQRKSRFVRHNDWLAQKDNSYKMPTEEYPTHRLFRTEIQFNPATESNIEFVVLMKHLTVTLDDPTNTGLPGTSHVDIEFSDTNSNRIVFLALRQAGVSLREADFVEMVSNEIRENE